MKSLQNRAIATSFMIPVLLGLVAMLACVQPLLADDFMNISDVKECRKIDASAERLLCYDTVMDGGIFNEQKLKQVQVENFGSDKMRVETEVKTRTQTATGPEITTKTETKTKTVVSTGEISVTVVRMQKDGSGVHYFQTSDGQVWKQQNSGRWSSTTPFEAIIKEGTMGSYFLVNEGGKSTRVKRVR